jgi:hypothetical protein
MTVRDVVLSHGHFARGGDLDGNLEAGKARDLVAAF